MDNKENNEIQMLEEAREATIDFINKIVEIAGKYGEDPDEFVFKTINILIEAQLRSIFLFSSGEEDEE